jgi:hypothetical protein
MNSVFTPINHKESLSATSEAPLWSAIQNAEESAQAGGARKKKSAAKKSASKKSASKKNMKGGSKKSSKKASKKGSKKGMKRELPQGLKDILELKSKLKDYSAKSGKSVSQGADLTKVASDTLKANKNSVSDALSVLKKELDSGELAKRVEKAKKAMNENRAAKKAKKAKAMSASE